MSQAPVILPGSPLTGAAAAADMSAAWAAMISKFSGATAPTLGPGAAGALVEGQEWLDTSVSPHVLRIWDGALWLPYNRIDTVKHSTGPWNFLAGSAFGVDLNTVADTTIPLILPSATYILEAVWVVNRGTTASLTNALVALRSASGGGGTLLTGPSPLSSITSNTINTTANAAAIVSNSAVLNLTTLFFRVTTPQGAAASADVHITVHPIPYS
jgi:hypothetical protein